MDTDPKPTVTIAYLSGTPTHDRDFRSAANGLIWALDQYPNARLVTVGTVVLDVRFRRFGDRVEQRPLRPWQQLAEVLASVDINIAPLEPDNVFTNAKSSIKYLEAALAGVPTIASPRSDFRRVITHGVNGFLAESPDEWRDALHVLIDSADLRRQVGQRVREDVLRNHTTASAASSFYAGLAEIVAHPDTDERMIINWAVPVASDREPGGPRAKVLELADALSRRGHHMWVCVVPDRALGEATIFPSADITIATADWSTADLVAAQGGSTFRAYFVQDDPASIRQSPAEQLASLPLRYIGYGQDVAQALADHAGRPAAHLDSGADAEHAAAELERILLRMTLVRGRRATSARAEPAEPMDARQPNC